MKRIMNWVLVTTLICGFSLGVTSCADNNDNPVPTKKKYRLVQRKEIYDDSDTYYITDYGYDSQGRLKSFVRRGYNTPFGDIVDANYTYTYGDHYIIEKQGNDAYYTYTLNDDGLIVKEQGTVIENGVEIPRSLYSFQYEDGRIISDGDTNTSFLNIFHWEDGDLMYYGLENEGPIQKTSTFTRSGLSVDHGYMKEPKNTMSEGLYMMGYFGKPSKHLESHFKLESKGGDIYLLYDHDYTYTIADGHIVEMVDFMTSVTKGMYESALTNKTTTTFTYEEYE